jgi:hypothetical protein
LAVQNDFQSNKISLWYTLCASLAMVLMRWSTMGLSRSDSLLGGGFLNGPKIEYAGKHLPVDQSGCNLS